jgi:predicted O-methyltransferase YrrM
MTLLQLDIDPRLRWIARAGKLAAQDPAEGLDRAVLRVRAWRGQAIDERHELEADPDWERHLHEALGAPWPCDIAGALTAVWAGIEARLTAQGYRMGRATYGGWDDADQALARAVWCLTGHLHPEDVVETGVARGVTSSVILERLERAEAGHLWSIDLPALDPSLHEQIGVAVPPELRRRWTYIRGTSRQRLPRLLGPGPIDLFVHDSIHTERNLRRELRLAWAALRPGGAIVADDIERNGAFEAFASATPDARAIVAQADDGAACFGILIKRPAHPPHP